MSAGERAGRLYIVATPIGSIDDITVRALRVLREVDAILAEDTRRTRILTSHHGIETKLRSFHAHSSSEVREGILDELERGARFALVSDAGTPLVSDPGYELVDAARERGIAVEHLPGPSAVLTALSVAGLRCDDFRFVGFLPRSGSRRRQVLDSIAASETTIVFFESPNRTRETLEDLAPRLAPGRRLAVCRELTKKHEEVLRGDVQTILAALPEDVLGEITVVVEGAPPREADEATLDASELDARIDTMLARGLAPKAIAKSLAESSDFSTRDLYKRVLDRRR